ncbi:pyrophosphate--fructose 6-phosphate 1-phosphotransferase subunit alpha [Tanacetum coccineum]|uniref:Pyrophosphate--fructose 6-phosphate 1-phosphotransferase subunit alpha n=1 Tax=Tanacetum coccineum TaxID=301880 RepID=A0ABQ5EZ16_9ASTR
MDFHAGNPCELEIDLTAKSSSPIIEGMDIGWSSLQSGLKLVYWVTRSISDDDLKPGVTAEPKITKTILSDDDEYLVNSQLISNVCTYALSAEKYYYFIRLMGRKASHVSMECTMQSHPNMVPWSNERPLENKELNAIIGAWFTLWRN